MCNAQSAKEDDNETSYTPESYPAIAYFVVYKECATCNEKILFSTIHNEELDAEVTRIRVRKSSDSNNEMEKAAKQLFQVVKDHNNNTIQEMLQISNVYCYKNSEGTPSEDDEEDDQPEFASTHFFNVLCCIIVVNESEFRDRVATAVTKLESDGLVVDLGDACVEKLDNPPFSSNTMSPFLMYIAFPTN